MIMLTAFELIDLGTHTEHLLPKVEPRPGWVLFIGEGISPRDAAEDAINHAMCFVDDIGEATEATLDYELSRLDRHHTVSDESSYREYAAMWIKWREKK